MERNSFTSVLWALLALLCWSTVATAFKLALEEATPFELLCLSTGSASIILLLILLLQRKLHRLASLVSGSLLRNGMEGLINPFCYYLILFSAYSMLPAQLALPLNYTWPLAFLILYAILYKKAIRARQWSAVLLAIGGICLMSLGNEKGFGLGGLQGSQLIGISLALLSAGVWAYYWIRNIGAQGDPVVRMFLSFGFASLLLWTIYALAWFSGSISPITRLSAQSFWACVYAGAFEMAIPFVAWSIALQQSHRKTLINQLSYLAPIGSMCLIHLVLKEKILPQTVWGSMLILIGLLLSAISPKPFQSAQRTFYAGLLWLRTRFPGSSDR